jgi:hypothetical protein
VYPKAIEGLPEQRILAKSGLTPETPAAISAGEQARRQGHRIADGEGGVVVGSVDQKRLPEVLFDLPEVGRLPAEGCAMHPHEVREVVGVVAPEVGKELRVFIESKNSPTISMVMTSESHSVGVGPRARRRPRSATWSSTRHKTAMMKVLRSTRVETSFLLG